MISNNSLPSHVSHCAMLLTSLVTPGVSFLNRVPTALNLHKRLYLATFLYTFYGCLAFMIVSDDYSVNVTTQRNDGYVFFFFFF